ncbi:hypothetical protein [Microbacterium sp. JZ101]
MTAGAASPALAGALERLRVHGRVVLTGCESDPVLRWLRRRRILVGVALGVAALGALGVVAGLLLRDDGLWALMPVGAFAVFWGAMVGGLLMISTRLMGDRLRSERQPVVVEAAGITLRGIGPVPWSDVDAPERRRIPVKGDIGGICAVMPLTAQGRARVSRQPAWWRLRVGPRPYLRTDVPCLLLPGIEGLTEDEALQLLSTAHERYAR